MTFLAAENENQQLKGSPQADFGRLPEGFSVGKDRFNNWEFCLMKIRPIVCFCSDSTHVFILSALTHCTIFTRGVDPFIFIH